LFFIFAISIVYLLILGNNYNRKSVYPRHCSGCNLVIADRRRWNEHPCLNKCIVKEQSRLALDIGKKSVYPRRCGGCKLVIADRRRWSEHPCVNKCLITKSLDD
jgi:predicted RNA-binding Zn-ribbon protein involved in translation (DUF1610 family)